MNIFLDCGFYKGIALKSYIDTGIVDNNWIIYAFEPNPDLTIPELPKNIKLIKKAVWTKAGKMKFHISGREDAASLAGTSGHIAPKEITVRTFDFSKFVQELPRRAFIICSMDIEGAEYPVLRKMIDDGTAKRISLLDIEFHHRLIVDKEEEDSQKLIYELEDLGIEIKLKVPLH